MINRYHELKDHIHELFEDNERIKAYFLTWDEEMDLKDLTRDLENFQSVSLMLQRDDTKYPKVITLFEGIIVEYPNMKKYLSLNGA